MKKSHLLYLSAGILLIITMYFLLHKRSGTLTSGQRNIALSNPFLVTHINLSDPQHAVALRLVNGQWILNDSCSVKPGLVQAFLRAAEALQVKAPIAPRQAKAIVSKIKQEGILVMFFSGNDKIKEYRIWGDSTEGYLLPRFSRKPVLFEIPGFPSAPYRIFNASAFYWKDEAILHANPALINEIRIEYMHKQEHSLVLAKQNNGSWQMTKILAAKTSVIPSTSVALNDLLHSLQRIPWVETPWSRPDSISEVPKRELPFATITIKETQKGIWVKLYSHFIQSSGVPSPDPDYCLAVSSEDPVPRAIRYVDLDNILIDSESIGTK